MTKIIKSIKQDKYAPHKVIGVIDPYGLEKNIKGSEILGKLNKLESLCKKENISEIIQCDGFEHTLNLISLCDEKKIKFWTKMAAMTQSTVKKLKEKEID